MRENHREYEYEELFAELSDFEQKGYDIQLDGLAASPMQIVAAHMTKEGHNYMRDYIFNEKGGIKSLCFDHIRDGK